VRIMGLHVMPCIVFNVKTSGDAAPHKIGNQFYMVEDLKTSITFVMLCLPIIMISFWAIFDASQREFGTMGKKAAWILVAAVPFVGFIVYLIFGRWRGKKMPG